jgi:hypothetical protein
VLAVGHVGDDGGDGHLLAAGRVEEHAGGAAVVAPRRGKEDEPVARAGVAVRGDRPTGRASNGGLRGERGVGVVELVEKRRASANDEAGGAWGWGRRGSTRGGEARRRGR